MKITRPQVFRAATFVAFVLATLARGPGPFKWDAAHYWAATQAMVGALPAVPAGYWELRGIFTPFIYAPAAALTRIVGDQHAGWAVVLQNSIVLAAAGVFLLPAVLRIWRPVTTPLVVIGAILLWVVTSGFAAYPLVDIYPALAIVGLFVLVRSDRRWVLAVAGVLAGIAMNIRPAYLLVIILVVITVVIWKRVLGVLFAAGVAVALLPQIVMNVIRTGSWNPLPTGSDALVTLQAGFAAYVVRYDTMIGDESARQFYCSPEMARLVGDHPPQSAGELAVTLLQTVPTSLLFSFEKVSASLFWHSITPYSAAVRPIDVVFGVSISLVAVLGIVALFFAATRRVDGRRDGFGVTMLAAVITGTALTLVSSATETRFALLLVLLGIVGLTVTAGVPLRETWRTGRWWIAAGVLAATVVLAAGAVGLAHPGPRGDVTTAICDLA